MYPLFTNRNDRGEEVTASLILDITPGEALTKDEVKHIDSLAPNAFVSFLSDPERAKEENKTVPLSTVLDWLQKNEVSTFALGKGIGKDAKSVSRQHYLRATRVCTIHCVRCEEYVAVINGQQSTMEYDTPFEAMLYAWAKFHGHCD